MNKSDLVDEVASRTGLTKKAADLALSEILAVIMERVAAGEKVMLVGFGTFEARKRQERAGRNPKTGEVLTLPASTVPAFSAGKLFKAQVSEND